MKYILILLLGFSCTKGPSTPEGLLEMFVTDVTSKSIGKDYYEKYTDGELWESVSELSEEDFNKFLKLNKVKNPKVSISNKNCVTDVECTLTYVVKYNVTGEEKSEYKSEVKKVATIKQVEGNWKIFEVNNIKTYHDSKTPLEVLKD